MFKPTTSSNQCKIFSSRNHVLKNVNERKYFMFNVIFLYSLKITNHTAVCHWQVLTTLIPLLGVELLVSSVFSALKLVASFIIAVSLLKENYLNMYLTRWFLSLDLNCYLKCDRCHTLPLQSILRAKKTVIFQSVYGSQPLWSHVQSSWLQTQRSRVRFPVLPYFLSSSGSGTGSTQPHEHK
jgi:hypothetical protein